MRIRLIVIFMAMSLVLASSPAAAKPTKPPADPPVAATLTFADAADGLAGDLVMRAEMSRNGAAEYFADGTGSSAADLELRGFDQYLDQGLHLGLARLDPNECGEPPLYEGVFWLSFDRDGVLTAVMWHFDVDASYLATRKKGCSWLINERYTIRSLSAAELQPGEAALSFADDTVSGTFKLHRYDADAAEPHVDLARSTLTFGLVLDQ